MNKLLRIKKEIKKKKMYLIGQICGTGVGAGIGSMIVSSALYLLFINGTITSRLELHIVLQRMTYTFLLGIILTCVFGLLYWRKKK